MFHVFSSNPPQQPQPLKRPTIPTPTPNDHKIISVADFNPQSIGYRTTNRCPCPKCDLSPYQQHHQTRRSEPSPHAKQTVSVGASPKIRNPSESVNT